MAAIDKIYVNSYDEYQQFKQWCALQPPLEDKYGKKVRLVDYLYRYDEPFEGCHPSANLPYYLDAYIIRHCTLDFVLKELQVNYGYWSQQKKDEAYKIVMERGGEEGKMGEYYSWLTKDDFKVVDGVVTMPNLEKSSYEKIRDGELYTTPWTSHEYTVGKHFKCIHHPAHKYDKPFGCKNWFVSVHLPDELDDLGFLWYHEGTDTWDFSDEFVVASWSSSDAFVPSIRALKRKILKWKLPVGAKVRLTDRLIGDDYTFIIKK